jgi:hypothetical protein
MSDDAAELSILIKTTLDKLAIQQAKEAINGLDATTKNVSGGVMGATSSVNGLSSATSKMRSQLADARNISQALDQALSGNLSGALRQVGGLSNSASAALGKLGIASMVVVALKELAEMGGAAAGRLSTMGQAVAELKDPLTEAELAARLSEQALKDMASVKFEALKNELSELDQVLSNSQRLEQVKKRKAIVGIRADEARDVARMEAEGTPGPDRDKAVAERKARANSMVADVEEKYAASMLKTIADQQQALIDKKRQLKDEADQANAEFERVKSGPHSPVELANARDLRDQTSQRKTDFNAEAKKRDFDLQMQAEDVAAGLGEARSTAEVSKYTEKGAYRKADAEALPKQQAWDAQKKALVTVETPRRDNTGQLVKDEQGNVVYNSHQIEAPAGQYQTGQVDKSGRRIGKIALQSDAGLVRGLAAGMANKELGEFNSAVSNKDSPAVQAKEKGEADLAAGMATALSKTGPKLLDVIADYMKNNGGTMESLLALFGESKRNMATFAQRIQALERQSKASRS